MNSRLFRALAAAASLIAPLPMQAGVVISEFQAANQDTIRDADGDTSDWIELYNDSATAADLTGMTLTNDPLTPAKWTLPAVTLAPLERRLVWASGKNRNVPAGELHTNFVLAAEGGHLALHASGGRPLTQFAPYPAQPNDRSWGTAYTVENVTPMAAGAACRVLVPTATLTGWQASGFNDSTWTAASTGIGYDRTATPTDYTSLIGAGGNVEAQMFGLRTSCFIRVPFTVANPAGISSLTLRMLWEDGFAAWLNGTRLNPPAPAATNSPASPLFNQTATAVRLDTDAVVPQDFDLTSQASLLVSGTNVLAIHALNQSSGSSDLLIVPEITYSREDRSGPAPLGYMAVPTPGTPNEGPVVAGFADAPDFSVKRGFFTAPFTVSLTTNTPESEIRYTTDSSAPTESSTLYNPAAPVSISATTVLRAATFRAGWKTSAVKTHTYLFASGLVAQPAAPAGFPATWGNEYDFTSGTLTGPAVTADYRMDPGVTGAPAYAALMVPAITTTLPVVSLATSNPAMFDFDDGIYSNARLTAVEIPASIEFFNPLDTTGRERFQEDIGLRMHGGDAPLEHPKKPFRIYFRKKYGTDRLRYPLYPGSPVDEFDKLQLRPGGHDGWSVPFGSADTDLAAHATYLRDRFLRQTELDMGRLSHRGRYVHLCINGLYWGVYDLHEVISSEFFASHKGGAEPDWDVYEHSNTSSPLFDVVEGTSGAMDSLLALVRPPENAAQPATYAAIQALLPLDEFIDHMLVQMWGAQNDWMGPVFRGIPNVNLTDASRFFNKNWESGRLSRGLLPNQGLFWQVWDAEISMGNSLTNSVPTMRVTDFNHTLVGTPTTEIPRTAGTPGPPGELWYALRKHSPEFRRRVADRIQRHFFNDGALSTPRMLARLQALRDQLDLPLVAESARWGDVNSGNPVDVTFTRDTHWRSEVDWMRDTYIPGRAATIRSQMAAIGMWPAVQAPVLSQHGGTVPTGYQLAITNPNASGTIYYTLDGTDPAGPPGAQSTVELIGPSSSIRYKVPTAAYASNSWKNLPDPSDIATWSTGAPALGFQTNGTFAPHFTTTVTGMAGTNATLYTRMAFSVTPEQKAAMTGLTLSLKYDDGAFIFLNGSTPLFRLNAPTTSPAFTSTALTDRADATSVVPEVINLTPQIAGLSTTAPNLLAIQGLNESAANPNFLLSATLTAQLPATETPSGTAIAYSGPVTLPSTGPVKARVLSNGTWSPLIDVSFIVGVPASASNLTVSEFSYNPELSSAESLAGFTAQQFEFIELMNISADTVQLTGCRFDDGVTFDFTANSTVQFIPPGQRIILVSNAAAFALRHPGVTPAGIFQVASNLSNSGERIELIAADNSPIADFVYDDNAPWPVAPDGGGFSLVLRSPASDPDLTLPGNWRASAGPGGSPGAGDADSFAAWAARTAQSSDPAADSDQNGLSGLVEYGLGLVPSASETDGLISAQFEMVSIGGVPDTYLVVRFRRNRAADDVIVTPEYSTGLDTWLPMTAEAEPSITAADGTETVAVRTPLPVASGPRYQVRVTVTQRP